MSSIVIPRPTRSTAFSEIRGLSAKGLTLGLTSAGVIDGKGQPFDLTANEFLTPYNDRRPARPSELGLVLRSGATLRNGDAYTIDHLGSTWLDGVSEFTIGIIYKQLGSSSTDEDTLFGKWSNLQGQAVAANSRRTLIRYDSGNAELDFIVMTTTADSVKPTIDLNDGEFHWIVGRFSASTLSLWVDGVELGSSASTASTVYNAANTAVPEFMGGHVVTTGSGADSPRGDFKAWFVSERAWTDAEIRDWYEPSTRWDWVDTGYSPIIAEVASTSTSPVVIPRRLKYWSESNPANVGLEFDGSTEKVVYPATGKLPLSGFVWARGRGTADLDSQYLASDFNSSSASGISFNWWTYSGNGRLHVQYYQSGGATTSANRTWSSGALSTTELRAFGWSHSGSFSQKEHDLYFNGESHVGEAGFSNSGTSFELSPTKNIGVGGRSNDANRGWDGDIHLLTLWDVELTAEEHARLGAGAHPLTIRPDRIIFHPDNTRNVNVATGDLGTVTGTPTYKPSDYSNLNRGIESLVYAGAVSPPSSGYTATLASSPVSPSISLAAKVNRSAVLTYDHDTVPSLDAGRGTSATFNHTTLY